MTPVAGTIAALQNSLAASHRTARITCELLVGRITDAVRPGVIALYGHAIAYAALRRKKQCMIRACPAVVHFLHGAVVLPPLRVLQIQRPALVGVRDTRARSEGPSCDQTTAAWDVHRSIHL